MVGSFYLFDHQHKGRCYADALIRAGYRQTPKIDDPELVCAFFDHDLGAGGNGLRSGMEFLCQHNIPVLMYPHSARPMVQWDGMYPVWPHTSALITIGSGHRQVMESFGYPLPVEVCGWTLCDQVPFKIIPVGDHPIEVLFGPIHPNANGWLHPLDKGMNALVYRCLLETPGIHLTVRHIKRLDISGLWLAAGVKYIMANPNGSTVEMDATDVVVGYETFAYLAVARGKPLLMFGDQLIPHSGNLPTKMHWAKNFDNYREIWRYPISFDMAHGGKFIRQQIERAMSQDVGCAWRKKFIGKQLDPVKFVKTVQKYIK
jgi:hypothetical protein